MMANWKRRSTLDKQTLTVNLDQKAKENGRKRKLTANRRDFEKFPCTPQKATT